MTSLIPHPVLASNRSDYKKESSFSMTIDSSQRTIDGNIRVSMKFVLKSNFIYRLITSQQAEFCVVVKCSRTYKRDIYQTGDTDISWDLSLGDYADKIVMSPFIVSTQTLDSFKSEEHDEEFHEIPFSVPAGSILAIGAGYEFTVDSLQTLGAAIRLVTYNELEDGEYVIDVEDEYINIRMNADTHRKVDNIRKTNKNILYPTLYMSALTHAIMHVDEATDRKWAQVLDKTLDKRNINKDDIKDAPYLIAQKLLINPLNHILTLEDQYD